MEKLLFLGIIFLILLSCPLRINIALFAFLFPFNKFGISLAGLNLTLSDFFFYISLLQVIFISIFQKQVFPTKVKKMETGLIISIWFFIFGNSWILVNHLSLYSFFEFFQRVTYVIAALYLGRKCLEAKLMPNLIDSFLFGSFIFSVIRNLLMIAGDSTLIETHKNSSGLVLAIAFAISLSQSQKSRSYSYLAIWFFISTSLTLGRSSILAIIVISLFFAMSHIKNLVAFIRISTVGLFLIFPLAIMLNYSNKNYLVFWDRDLYGRFDFQIEARRKMNQAAIEYFRENPLVGYGYGGLNGLPFGSSHNLITQSAVEGGIVFLSSVVILFVLISMKLWKFRGELQQMTALYCWLIAIFHALADSYWTRGRISFTWLLVGAAFAYWQSRQDSIDTRAR